MHHISFAQTVDITERWKFMFRAAAANAFNHPNFVAPAPNMSTPGSVGVISGLRAGAHARSIELRGHIDF